MTTPRHVNFTDIGRHTADGLGHDTKQTRSLTDLVNAPPLGARDTNDLLAILVYQQAAVIEILQAELAAIRREVGSIRKDINSAQTKKLAAREKAAKAEERAAKAREKAAIAEAESAAASEPDLLIQVGDSDNWEQLQDRIRRKF